MNLRRALPWAAAVLGAALLGAAPGPTAADAPPRNPDPGGGDDVQDLLYLAEGRPYVFRLHILVDGKPYSVRWAERVGKVFDYLDRDGDGVLSKEEVGMAPAAQQLGQMFRGVPYGTVAFNDGSLFAEMDADRDGKVTREEFLTYYRRGAGGPAQLAGATGRGAGANALTETLFKVLDADRDGKLSKKELMSAESILRVYDANDDEIIAAEELTQTAALNGMAAPGVMQAPAARMTPFANAAFRLVPREDAPRRVAERLKLAKEVLALYDKDKSGKLSPAEIGLPKEVFDRYDADKDGEWSAVELLRWMVFAPDVETAIRLGEVPDKDGLLDLVNAPDAAGKDGVAVRKTAVNAASVGMNDALISLIRGGGAGRYGQLTDGVYQGYDQQFQQIDKDDKGYVTRDQLAGGQSPTLYAAFPIIDRDGNGRLTEEELKAWVALATDSVGAVPTISVADNGRALFEMIDANSDGRLTIRELRGAWARMAPYDRDHDEAISREEIPQQFQLTVAENDLDPNAAPQGPMQVQMAAPAPAPARVERGPLWFRKMDTNGDGDVSPREFLGSPEDFRRIDTDGDGLISLDEAEAFDAQARGKKGDK